LAARSSRIALAVLGLLSLVLVASVNRLAGRSVPAAPWLTDSCAASFLVCLGIYVAIRPARPFAAPVHETDWRAIRRIAGIWLAVWISVVAVWLNDQIITHLTSAEGQVGRVDR
jgi:hypothetical protein